MSSYSTPEDRFKLGLRLRERTITLYSQVLEYQIRLTKQLSRSGLFQYMRDIATADDWKEMLTEIKCTDKSIEDILGDWSKKTVQEIHAELTSMKHEVERQLNIVLDTINVRYIVFRGLLSTRHNLIDDQSRPKQRKIN